MKKKILLTLGALSAIGLARGASNDVSGQTFLTVRPEWQSPSPAKSSHFWPGQNEFLREGGWGSAFQGAVFGGRSTGSTDLGKYFMFGGKTSLFVAGDDAVVGAPFSPDQGVGRDVNPFYFNIRSATVGDQTFSSTITFRPQQTVVGGGFEFRSYISWFGCDCNGEPQWWFDLSFPVMNVRNDMRLSETVITPQTTPAAGTATSMTQAFMGGNGFSATTTTTWLYGKINGSRNKTGVADVEVKLGFDYNLSDCSFVSGYFGFVAPTGNRPKAQYVFEPIVGNNHHWGILTGGYMGYELMEFCQGGLFLEVETNARYLFSNHQVRSFDLYNRPWSRYMAVYTAAPVAPFPPTALTPGINVFTQPVTVHPHFQHSITTALMWQRCGFEAELGYNFWARQAEGVRLRNAFGTAGSFPTGVAIADVTTPAPDLTGDINRASTIGANFGGTAIPYSTTNGTTITQADLNLQSAATPAALTHTVYGSLGYNWDCWCWPVFVSAGGSYEFSTNNVALNRWLAWGKLGISL